MSPVTRFSLTALSYILPTMILGYTWHLIIFKELYENLGIYNRAEPIIPLGFTSMIIQGLIIAYLFPFYAKGQHTFAAAMKFSLIMGLFHFNTNYYSRLFASPTRYILPQAIIYR
jgi:hypothetical protein